MEITQTLLECIRENVRDTLGLLSDADAQLEYAAGAPHDDVPAELISIWADATYIPDNLAFERAFVAPDLAELATFDRVIAAAKAALAPVPADVEELHARAEWQRVMKAAATTLRRLHARGP